MRYKKKKRVRKIILGIVAAAGAGTLGMVGTLAIYNQIMLNKFKEQNLDNNDFSSNQVFDPNGNDFMVDDNDSIVFDTTTEEERSALISQFSNFILTDANSRSSTKIEKVEKLISINMLPNNMYDENDFNKFDKYCLSLLFTDGNTNYTLNYVTSTIFECQAELSKNVVGDFITYLSYDCALDNCQQMSKIGQQVLNALGSDVIFVGDCYAGVRDSGEDCYYVPIYHADCSASVYYASKSLIDMDELNPMQTLCDEIVQQQSVYFTSAPITQNFADLKRVADIYFSMQNANQTAPENNKTL